MANRPIRPIRIEGNLAFVPLTQGYEAIIDASDAELVSGVNWQVYVDRNRDGSIKNVYAVRTVYDGGNRWSKARMHRVIRPAPDDLHVDHVDGNGLNNRRANLRIATNAQNTWNSGIRANNTSGFKGVTWNKRQKKWIAQIGKAGKTIPLGVFDTPDEAHLAYCAASARLHGEFGRTC